MKKHNRIIALALAVGMTLSLLVTGASAAEPSRSTYSDVPATAAYSEAVEWLTENGIMEGTGNGRFSPNAVVTRAQAVTAIGKMANAVPVKTNQFSDVSASAEYAGYVGWAVENGIVKGTNGRFMPNDPVTGVQLDLMLNRYARSVGMEESARDGGSGSVTRAELARRLYKMCATTMPVRVQVSATGHAGCDPNETSAQHAAHSSSGWIMGYTDRGIYTFMGVQYATARRFENPKPANVYGSNGVTSLYSADQNRPTLTMVRGAASPQAKTNTVYRDGFGFAQSMTPSGPDLYGVEEECLNLNVWTDTMDSNAKKPVLVFMHGGGTNSDSATGLEVYDGHGMAEHTDVVFVTVNARLGTLGYSTDFTAIGGGDNLAYRDMLLSLEWVKENIAKFGGDPNNVTIAGQSGGGSKVGGLVSSKYADDNDLFQKVVLISASAGGSGVSASNTKEIRNAAANSLAQAIIADKGNDVTNVAGVLPYLQSFRSDEIDAVLRQYEYSGGRTVDGYIFDENSQFNQTSGGPITARAAQYTYMVGNTWSEMVGADSIEVIQYNQFNRAKAYMTEAQKLELMEAMRHQEAATNPWTGAEIPAATMRGTLEEIRAAYAKVFPDHDFYDLRTLVSGQNGGFTRDNYYNSSMQISDGGATVYEYFMAYEFPYFGGTAMYHTGDLAFWFYSLGNVQYQIAGDEANAYKVADFCSTALANFCRTGDPSVAGTTWLPHEEGNAHCMIVDVNNRLVDGDYGAELIELMEMIED